MLQGEGGEGRTWEATLRGVDARGKQGPCYTREWPSESNPAGHRQQGGRQPRDGLAGPDCTALSSRCPVVDSSLARDGGLLKCRVLPSDHSSRVTGRLY